MPRPWPALYLAAYLGLAGPVIGLGALTQIASTRVSLLVFCGLLALGIFAADTRRCSAASRPRRIRATTTHLPMRGANNADRHS